ncbi:hypothetical protein [Janibacter corallicola]|uniref:hypothetical protein n=1 Tax=Janibacter corallicola TaxID=415212 RepID=UPI000829AE5C|nr:hypothetical protein [Janibacter corallicola]
MRHTRPGTSLTLTLASALALAVAGCSSEGTGGPDSSSSDPPSSSSTSTDLLQDEDHALDQAKKAIDHLNKHNVNKPLDEEKDADWASPQYVHDYNKELEYFEDKDVTQKGKIKSTSVHLKKLDPKASGGPDLTVIDCSVSTVRMIAPNGKDVTGDIETGKPVPKKPIKSANLVSLTSTDKGETWQMTGVQLLTGKSAKEAPCDVS